MEQNTTQRKIRKAVITGATGQLGMALIDELLRNDCEVTVISREGSSRISNVLAYDTVTVIECNFDRLTEVSKELSADYDIFYHLAWAGSGVDKRNNIDVQLLNIPYTMAAVRLAKALGCKCFIGAGSQAEYGNVEGKISAQTPANPNIAYGAMKLCAGYASRIACELTGLEHIWARVFSVYGPYTGKGSVLIDSIEAFLKGCTLKYTKCEQIWDYMYSADAAKALYLLGEKGISGKVYCIGSGETKRLSEYLEILKNEINPELTLSFGDIPYRLHQVMHLEADISELKEDTGFYTEYSFEQGIKETIDWVKSRL